MKRFLCAVIILCFVPIFAVALDLSEFNACSAVLGAPELDLSDAKTVDEYTRFISDKCFIFFVEDGGNLQSIYIDGQGDSFLAYCCAALHLFDPSGSTNNHGQLLTMYLMAHRDAEHQAGQTTNGLFMFVEPSDNGYLFMIGE